MKRVLAFLRRRWLLVLVIIGVLVLVILQFGVLQRLFMTLLQAQVQWVAVAVLLQVFYYGVYSVLYQISFATVEVESRASELLPVLFASIFLKAVVPSGGISAVAIFVDDAARRGQSGARAAEGSLLVLVADVVMTLPLLLYGLIFLSLQGVLQFYQVITSVLYVLFAVLLTVVLLLGRLQPERLRTVLEQAQRTINGLAARLRRPPLLGVDWAERNARECIGAACDIAEHPRPLTRTLLVAFFVHFINVGSLFAVGLAYRVQLSVGALLAAFGLDVVFSVINIIPHGIGVAEGIMSLVFISLGIPGAISLAISVTFRGLNVWLPLALGFLFVGRVRAFGAGGPPQRS